MKTYSIIAASAVVMLGGCTYNKWCAVPEPVPAAPVAAAPIVATVPFDSCMYTRPCGTEILDAPAPMVARAATPVAKPVVKHKVEKPKPVAKKKKTAKPKPVVAAPTKETCIVDPSSEVIMIKRVRINPDGTRSTTSEYQQYVPKQ